MSFNMLKKLQATILCGTVVTPLVILSASAGYAIPLNGSIIPFPEQSRVLGNANLDEVIEFQIALKMRNFADLQAQVAQGRVISPAEMEARYYPLAADQTNLIQWLQNQGLTVVKTYNNRLTVEVKGTLRQVSRAFAVSFVQVLVEGKAFNATQSAPTIPDVFQRFVVGLNGLQPFLKAVPQNARLQPQSPTQPFIPPYSVNDILRAYNATSLGLNGTNQKIAILIDTVPLNSDLQAFWSANAVPQSLSRIETVNVTGAPLPPPTGEETLDVAWSSAIAPQSTVRIYATSNLAFTSIDQGLQRIISDLPSQPNLRHLSISLGACERRLSSSQIQTDEQLFATLASQGVSTFVSSGDSGSRGSRLGGGCVFRQSTSYFASSQFVTAVGGTTLTLNSAGNVTSETGWSGSGGGISGVIPRPSWQQGAGVPASSTRLVPDISANADPNTGYYLVLNGQVIQIGGTSASAPVWAGFSALINQGRANAGRGPLGLLGPRIYPLIGNPAFRDIISGSNGAFQATSNYDLVTGIGVPVMSNLVPRLVNLP